MPEKLSWDCDREITEAAWLLLSVRVKGKNFQFRDCVGFESPFRQFLKNSGHFHHGFWKTVVRQNDCSGSDSVQNRLANRPRRRNSPISGIKCWHENFITRRADQFRSLFRQPALRRPEVVRMHTGCLENHFLRTVHFGKNLLRSKSREVGMRPRLICDLMSFGNNPPGKIGILLYVFSDHRKCGPHPCLFQRIENRRCISSQRTIIKNQGNLLARNRQILAGNKRRRCLPATKRRYGKNEQNKKGRFFDRFQFLSRVRIGKNHRPDNKLHSGDISNRFSNHNKSNRKSIYITHFLSDDSSRRCLGNTGFPCFAGEKQTVGEHPAPMIFTLPNPIPKNSHAKHLPIC